MECLDRHWRVQSELNFRPINAARRIRSLISVSSNGMRAASGLAVHF
jgi:hypothetical protein